MVSKHRGTGKRARRVFRLAFWAALVAVPLVLAASDRFSRVGSQTKRGTRLVTVNVNTHPTAIAETLLALDPDLVFMQETESSCEGAARRLGLSFIDGSDQCLLSRWPLVEQPVEWPGPWLAPQIATATHPQLGPLTLVNLRFAIPEVIMTLATMGEGWYTEQQRKNQFAALRALIAGRSPTLVCGDFNAMPFEVDLSERLDDMWTGLRLGATFPARLPAARIDQCWATEPILPSATWTASVPSDHRAVVADFDVAGASVGTGEVR